MQKLPQLRSTVDNFIYRVRFFSVSSLPTGHWISQFSLDFCASLKLFHHSRRSGTEYWLFIVSLKCALRQRSACVNVNVNEQFLSPRESCNIVTKAAPWVLSSAVYKNERVSATVTWKMRCKAVIHCRWSHWKSEALSWTSLTAGFVPFLGRR